MFAELVADCRADEIAAVGIETLLYQQVDTAQIDVAEIDREFFRFPCSARQCVSDGHFWCSTIQLDGIWMAIRQTSRLKRPPLDKQSAEDAGENNTAAKEGGRCRHFADANPCPQRRDGRLHCADQSRKGCGNECRASHVEHLAESHGNQSETGCHRVIARRESPDSV